MRHRFMVAALLVAGCCVSQAAHAAEAASRERGPPHGLMDKVDAARHWDGTGELLLSPQASTSGSKAPAFAIGATFDNSDAPALDIDAARSAFDRCPSLVYPARLAGGHLVITGPLGSPWHRLPAFRHLPNAGPADMTIELDACRYRLDLQVKLRVGEEWAPMADYVRPPPPPPIGTTRVLKPGETVTIPISPTPPELALYAFTMGVGPYVPPEIAAKCPELAGSLWLDTMGLYVDMPWAMGDTVVPGIRRDPDARTTTLIFQKAECRLELSVRREIRTNGYWQPSLLSRVPVNSAAQEERP